MDDKRRMTMIQAYAGILESRIYSCSREKDLPFPKSLIRQAMAEEIMVGKHDYKIRNNLENGFVELESFVTDIEFERVKSWEESFTGGKETVAGSDNPIHAVDQSAYPNHKPIYPHHIQSRILRKMEIRLEQIQAMRTLAEIWKA